MNNTVRIQDDLYQAVNGEWLASAVIPDDKPTTGGFSDLDEGVQKLMMADFRAFCSGEKTSDITGMEDAVKMYRKVLNTERRNREGIKPVLPLLHRISSIASVDMLNNQFTELIMDGVTLPFRYDVSADWKDATVNSLMITGPSTILPDTTYYGTPQGEQMMEVYKAMAAKALAFTDLDEEQQKQYLADTVAFDALVAQKVKSQLEWSEYVKMYNPMSVDEAAQYMKPLDLKGILHQIWRDDIPETIIVADPKATKEMNFYFSEDNLEMFVHWSYVQTLLSKMPYLSEEMASTSTMYRRALTGVPNDPVLEKQAYQMASRMFSEPIGIYYGRAYFGEEAKKDIVSLVRKIIETYKDRMRRNTFLQESTREKAILKLSTMAIKMGYPDEVRELYEKLHVDEADGYYDAVDKLMKVKIRDELEKLHKPVDRSLWAMPGHMVNACYDPTTNDITFPAAILQKPFYSINQTVSENLGGIGAVIGHEISHAFDNNGAYFDENGTLTNWWTEEDFAAFEKHTQEMIEEWDGMEYHGEKLNGEMVVSENIADNGGMAVTLEIMHHTEGADFQAYFVNWAKVWCLKMKPEYIVLLIKNDVHSPAELRANIQPRNFPEWYEAFGVTGNDGMYIAPEKRVIIW